jgi:hypothetical protein
MGVFPTRSSANIKQEDPSAYHPASLHIFEAFSLFPRSTGVFIKLHETLETLMKSLKTFSSSSPIFALSKYSTFGQTKTGAAVTLTTHGSWGRVHVNSNLLMC